METIKVEVEKTLVQLNVDLGSHKSVLKGLRSSLADVIKVEEDVLEKTFKELPSCEGRSGKEIGVQFQNLMKDIERIRPQELLLANNRKASLEGLLKTRKSLLDELSSIRAERSSHFERALKKLNKKLDGKLKLSASLEADRTPLIQFHLACNLDGVAEARLAWIKTAGDFSPVKLSELISEGSEALKNANWGVTNTVADALTRLTLAQRLEIAEIELPDIIKIELNVAHEGAENYRDLSKLSTGQQCTAILHLLLLSNLDPLIMDQPEDNLDNAFIADRIVSELRSAKIIRQFILLRTTQIFLYSVMLNGLVFLVQQKGMRSCLPNFRELLMCPRLETRQLRFLRAVKQHLISAKPNTDFERTSHAANRIT
ncbi:MAG: hypothetical protein ACXWTY_01320 [Methylobacter sp.]